MGAANSQELKRLQTLETQLRVEIGQLEDELDRLRKKTKEVKDRAQGVNRRIKELSQTDVVVTEHAMLRYVERVLGIDLDRVKRALLPPRVQEQVLALRTGEFPVPIYDGRQCRLIAKDGVIITIKT